MKRIALLGIDANEGGGDASPRPRVVFVTERQADGAFGGAWTGTRQDGTRYDSDCANWTSTSPIGCAATRRLICFER